MKTIWTTMGAVALIALLTLSTAHAQEAAAPAAAPPAATEPAAPPADSKDFEMTVDGKETEGKGEGHGLHITIDDDEADADVAEKVVDRVVTKLESSLASLPEDVRRDIGAEDMKELQAALADIRSMKHGSTHRVVSHESDTGELIGFMAVVLLFGGPIVIVAIVSFNNRRKRQMVHETIDRIISQGKDVPVELLDALDKGRNGKTMLQRGVINLAIGIGVAGMLYGMGGEEAASLGLIWFCIGLAQLLVWKLEKPRDDGATVS